MGLVSEVESHVVKTVLDWQVVVVVMAHLIVSLGLSWSLLCCLVSCCFSVSDKDEILSKRLWIVFRIGDFSLQNQSHRKFFFLRQFLPCLYPTNSEN